MTALNEIESGVDTAPNPPPKFIETIDPEDPEYRREMQRPADIKEDMRSMESRQRVSSILNSQAFREELESIIADQLKHGPHPSSLIALQQISELLLPNGNTRAQKAGAHSSVGSVLIPVNDIRGIDTLNYAKGERLLRCKLASCYRVMDLYGWSAGIANHISARLNQDLDHYLVNPYGLLYHEVTASSLIKLNSTAAVVDQGTSTYGVNKPSFSLHAAIYKARPDLRCIIHVKTQVVTAISAMKCGILPISQEAIECGSISYHDFKGIVCEDDVRKLLAEDLGPLSKIMVLRNHGLVACGESIEEACHHLFNVMAACEIQSRALVCGLENVHIPSAETQRQLAQVTRAQNESVTLLESKRWRQGELEFEALMRCLDNAGYRTGYMYRQPIMRNIDRSAVKEVEIPPTTQSHGFDAEYVRRLKEEKSKVVKGEWLNTPNSYARQETEETGTPNPKKITKWVPDASPSKSKTSTPIRIENKNQFAPQGADPKELKNHVKEMKQDRFVDKVTAGYQSKLLSNIEEPENGYTDGPDAPNGITREVQTNGSYSLLGHREIVYGAASKGIIKRDQQNNAVVYKTAYAAANPFQQMDPIELEKYKKEVTQKQMKEQESAKSSRSDIHDKHNKSEIITSENGKKKSITLPRSKSLLDKKHEKHSDSKMCTSGASSRDSSPNPKSNSTVALNGVQDSKSPSDKNKSQTMPAGEKPEKPKKKSKLSFLSRKKKPEVA